MKIFLVLLALVAIACARSHPVKEQQSGEVGDSAAEPLTESLLKNLLQSLIDHVIAWLVGLLQQRRMLPEISMMTGKFQEFLQDFEAKIESCECSLNPKCNLTKLMTKQITQTLTTELEALAEEYEPIMEYLESAAESVVRAFENIDEEELSDLKAQVMKWTQTFEDVAADFVKSVQN